MMFLDRLTNRKSAPRLEASLKLRGDCIKRNRDEPVVETRMALRVTSCSVETRAMVT